MIEVYPQDRLYEEIAFVAYHFNWDRRDLLEMPHLERQRWCEEISRINERINEMAEDESSGRTLGGGFNLPGM